MPVFEINVDRRHPVNIVVMRIGLTITMRPGQIQPNEFELAILDRLATKAPPTVSLSMNFTYLVESIRELEATRISSTVIHQMDLLASKLDWTT